MEFIVSSLSSHNKSPRSNWLSREIETYKYLRVNFTEYKITPSQKEVIRRILFLWIRNAAHSPTVYAAILFRGPRTTVVS